jgi:DNA-binding HxlR family transcriptional regulator
MKVRRYSNTVADRTYGLYDPLAQALDDTGERWALLVVRELLDGPRRYGELQQRLPGLSTARLADRLRELRAAGLIQDGYALTEQGRRLAPAIHALTRFGLARLRPLAGTATAYRPSFAAYALRARADAAASSAGPFLSVTEIESESFCTRREERGALTTWVGDPRAEPTDIVATDTVTAMALATGSWTLAQARTRGHLAFGKTADDGRRWAAAHGILP